MKQKIGILTYHNANNLGAVLQGYALQKTLEQMRVSAEILDYHCNEIEKSKHICFTNNPKNWGKSALKMGYYALKNHGFSAFRRKYLILSETVYTPETIHNAADKYDCFITGSDQVWNPACSGYDDTYFLDFVPDKSKCFSYAASVGSYPFTQTEKDSVAGYVKDFSGVSVREQSAADLLNAYGIQPEIHPDPVMLMTAEQWGRLTPKRIYRKPYVLVYMIQYDSAVYDAAIRYAQQYGLNVICNKHSIPFILNNSPESFLSWIYHAECVFTNSFHGCAFSCIFNKPLSAKVRQTDGKVNDRIMHLLMQADALCCKMADDQKEMKKPDAGEKLLYMRRKGLDYLQKVCES